MRRKNLHREALSSVPATGYVEVVQDHRNSGESHPQFILASIFGTSAALASSIAGGGSGVVATADGLTTGLIPATAEFVTVTCDTITKQISLPAAVAGKILRIFVPAVGCELISAVAADKVNNVVVGATNEAALVAGTHYTLRYDGVDNWVMDGLTATAGVEVPVIPDVL